jgi:hypothetical protein
VEPPAVVSPAVVLPAVVLPAVVLPAVVAVSPGAVPPGSLLGVGSVGSGDGSLVLLEVLLSELVGGSVVVVGGSVVVVVGGSVVVGGRRRGLVLDGGASVVEVAAPVVRGTITALCGRVVVGGRTEEVAALTCWCRASVVVVTVVCEVASATCRGEVAKATMLPPIAPISIAVTTLTQRRVATKATGLKSRTPPGRCS